MTSNTSITRSTQSAVMLERPMSTSSSIDNSFQFHDSYMRAVDALRKHLVGMSNPFLRKEIQNKLYEIANGVIDEREGIDANFTELNFPVDTRELIGELSRQIREEAKQSQGAIEKMMPAIKEDLLSLSTEKGLDSMLSWDELDFFLQLPQIKRVKDEEMKEIFCSILQGVSYDLQALVKKLLGKLYEEVDEQLKSTEYVDFNTLLAEIIDHKPQKKEGLKTYWDQPETFFKGKTLYLNNPQNLQTHNGTILECKIYPDKKVFRLHDGSELHVLNSFEVWIVKKFTYKMWDALKNGILLALEFEISTPTDRHVVADIPPGTYYIGNTSQTSFFNILKETSFTLIEIKEKKHYKITAHYASKDDTNPRITIEYDRLGNLRELSTLEFGGSNPGYHGPSQESKQKLVESHGLTVFEFNSIYRATKKQIEKIDEINQMNIEKSILIKDEKDQNAVKLRHLEDIKLKTEALRKDLLSTEHRALLNELIDSFAANEMQKIDFVLLQTKIPELAKRIVEISESYRDNLQTTISPESLLKKLVEDANYAILVDTEQSSIVFRTMELLKASNKHLQKIKDKRAIFFWGKTGAGKSSVIGYFLGAPLDIYINHVGDKVVDIKKGRVDDGRYPKIGQSLAESETLYAQGYPLPSDNHGMSEEILLADCPGFDDTRGADFELCTNLSIDRAVQECKEVNAIVIIVPVQAFLLDRGNSMLDLVDTIQERFPKTFNPDKPQHSARLFFLITKDVQAQPESVAKLRDGTRIRAILEEATKKLQELVNRAQEGIDVEFELSTVQRKLKIWQSILQMHTNGQVDVVNLTNQKERIRLLKKYSHTSDQSAPGRIGKKDYTPVMHGERMRMKFGKYIEMSTHTWIYRIFDQYLHKIPEAIFSIEKKISAKNQSIQEVKEEIDARTQKIIQLELTQEKVKELLKELEKAQTNSDALSKEQRSELQKRVDATTNAAVIDAEKEIQSLTHDSTRKTDRLNLTIQEIEKLNKKMSENELNLKSLRARVDELSTGNQLVELEHVHYSPNQPLNLIQLSHDVRQRRFDEMNPDIADSDILKSYSENTSTYCGKLAEDLFIEKRFKLVPIDPSLRAQFNNVHKVATTFANGKVGQYEAKVEGKKFEIALGFKASADGKKIVYSFNTIFDGKDLPEIKISHTIPNMDYNEATIIGLNSQISALEKEISGLGVELKGAGPVLGKEKEKDGIEKEIQDLETVINHKKAQVERLKKGMAADKLEEMIREKKAELNVIVEDLTKLKSFKELEDKLKSLQDEMQWEEERLKETQKTKRNLALIIYQQQEIAKLLREFSELATSTEGKEQFGEKRRNEMIESCHQYIKLFDAHFTKLLDECERTLNFRKHHEL